MGPSKQTPECDWALQELFERAARPSQRLQAHLARCPHCQQAQAFDRQLAARRLTPTAPAGLEQRVRQLQRRRRIVQRSAWSMAAAALIGTVGLAFWPILRTPPVGSPSNFAVATQPAAPEPPDLDQLLAGAFAPAPVIDVTPQDHNVRGLVSTTFLGGR